MRVPDIYPAIDLRDGRCVRLYQGDYGRETVYGTDPAAQATSFAAEGAGWIHVVDLDAARTGEGANRHHVAAICDAVDVPVQTGGGVRDLAAASALMEAGAARLVVGTVAAEDPAALAVLARRFPVAAGLDARGTQVAVRGWLESDGADLAELARRVEDAGVEALVVTEIGRDGTLAGPDLDQLGLVLDATDLPLIASGGVGSLDDLRSLAALRRGERAVSGIIVGRALYEGAFTLHEAIAAVGGVLGGTDPAGRNPRRGDPPGRAESRDPQ